MVHQLPSETPIPKSVHETIAVLLDLGLNYDQIITAVQGMRNDNIRTPQMTQARIMERIFGGCSWRWRIGE
jgi:hypothetical protein